MWTRHRTRSERDQLELFRALPGDLAPRDAQDLMAYPFFSLADPHRITPIDCRMNDIAVRVEAVPEHGMARLPATEGGARSPAIPPPLRSRCARPASGACIASPGSTNGPSVRTRTPCRRHRSHRAGLALSRRPRRWAPLTIDCEYFALTGSLERWLDRVVRKHAGGQRAGWRFDFRNLYAKSASFSPF